MNGEIRKRRDLEFSTSVGIPANEEEVRVEILCRKCGSVCDPPSEVCRNCGVRTIRGMPPTLGRLLSLIIFSAACFLGILVGCPRFQYQGL